MSLGKMGVSDLVSLFTLVAVVAGGGMWMAKADGVHGEHTAIEKTLSEHDQVLTLLKGNLAQRENLMATYVAWCDGGKFGKESPECAQARIWQASKRSNP